MLDLGCGSGSFPAPGGPVTFCAVDLETPPVPPARFLQADAGRLPFRAWTFDLIVCNHSLEHFLNLGDVLAEIHRTIKPSGALYVAVPDSTTLSDRLYRWLARGGGHVNPFSSASELAARIERTTGLRHAATRPLCTSFSFLNRKNARGPLPRRLWLFGGGTECSLRIAIRLLRMLDRTFGTGLSSYGWAFYFGNAGSAIDTRRWRNVCIRCGSAHPPESLRATSRWWPEFTCPQCGTLNPFE